MTHADKRHPHPDPLADPTVRLLSLVIFIAGIAFGVILNTCVPTITPELFISILIAVVLITVCVLIGFGIGRHVRGKDE